MVEVRELTVSDVDRWDSFVRSCPEATFFHLSGWREIIGELMGHRVYYLCAERSGQIEGVLPLARIRSLLFGDALISTPFCVYGGVAASSSEARKALIDRARGLANDLRVDHLELRNRAALSGDWPSKDLYVTFRKSISSDSEQNLSSVPRKQRAMIRKGIKAGLRSEIDSDIDRFFRLYAESVRNLGTPVLPKRYFRELQEVFKDDCEVLTILDGDVPVSSVMSFYFRDEVLPYYGGGGSRARVLKANDFMYWEVMRRAAERGVALFDYGRSKIGTGSYSFKKNWGFEPEPLHYQYHLVRAEHVPDVNPLNPKYQMFIRLWQRLPLSVSNRIGPILARQLG